MSNDDLQDKANSGSERDAFDLIDDKASKEEKGKSKEGELEDITSIGKEKDEDELAFDEDDVEEKDDLKDEKDDDRDADEIDEEDTIYQAVKKLDKDIFKKVPELKHVIFREAEYSKYFPTVEEAKEASELAETFNEFQNDITSGNSERLLEGLEATGKKNLENFVANFIPTLEKQNKQLYLDMMFPEFKRLLRYAHKNADERISNAARNIHYLIFNDFDLDSEAGLSAKKSEKSDKETELEEREQKLNESQFKGFQQSVFNTGGERMQKIIGFAFKNTDIPALLQKSLTTEIFSRVDSELQSDKRHMGNMNNLWNQAKRHGFTREWEDKIVNAYLTRAKLAIPKCRQAVFSEAKLSSRAAKAGEEKRQPTRIPSSSSAVSSSSSSKVDVKKIDWEKTSDRDLLDGKAVMRK